jgi:hypothetical protein
MIVTGAGRVPLLFQICRTTVLLSVATRERSLPSVQQGPTGGNVRPAAISSHVFLDRRLVAQCPVDDRCAEFPQKSSTGNIPPALPCHNASSGQVRKERASAGMQNGTCSVAIASYRTFPPAGPDTHPSCLGTSDITYSTRTLGANIIHYGLYNIEL